MMSGSTDMENKKEKRWTEVGTGRDNQIRFGQIETELQTCMTSRLKLNLRAKLGIRVTYVYLRNHVYKDDS